MRFSTGEESVSVAAGGGGSVVSVPGGRGFAVFVSVTYRTKQTSMAWGGSRLRTVCRTPHLTDNFVHILMRSALVTDKHHLVKRQKVSK